MRACSGRPNFQQTLAAFPIVLQGSGANAPFTTLGGLDNTWVQGRRAARFFINDNLAWTVGAHELRFGTNTRIFRLNDYDFGEGTVPLVTYTTLPQFIYGVASTASKTFPLAEFAALQFPESRSLCAGHLEGDFANSPGLSVSAPRTIPIRSTRTMRWRGSPDRSTAISHDVNQPLERGHRDRPRQHFRLDAAGDPAAEDGHRVADRAANRAAHRLRPVQRSFCPAASRTSSASIRPTRKPSRAACSARWEGRPSRREFPTAPSTPPSPPTRCSLRGFAQGQLSCASPVSPIPNTCLQPVAITAVPDGKLHAPYFMEWSFASGAPDRQHGQSARAVCRHARREPALHDAGERLSDGVPGLLRAVPLRQPADPRFGAVTQLSTGANSHYNGLQTTAEKRLGHGLQVQANYTWSHCIDTVSNGGFLSFSAGGILSPLPGDLERDRGPCDYDVRHNFTANYVYELPVKVRGTLWARAQWMADIRHRRSGAADFPSPC